jgi:aspartate aminotransferase-like enzyme
MQRVFFVNRQPSAGIAHRLRKPNPKEKISMYKKLFIPGPTHVRKEILEAQAVPMIGHRAKEYSDLQAEVTPKLQKLLYTQQRVYLFASSSTGVMEGSIRQASLKRMLVTVCGAFSKRWYEIVQDNGVA